MAAGQGGAASIDEEVKLRIRSGGGVEGERKGCWGWKGIAVGVPDSGRTKGNVWKGLLPHLLRSVRAHAGMSNRSRQSHDAIGPDSCFLTPQAVGLTLSRRGCSPEKFRTI